MEKEIPQDHAGEGDLSRCGENHGNKVGRSISYQGKERPDAGHEILTRSTVHLRHKTIEFRIGQAHKRIQNHDDEHRDNKPPSGGSHSGAQRDQT